MSYQILLNNYVYILTILLFKKYGIGTAIRESFPKSLKCMFTAMICSTEAKNNPQLINSTLDE